MFDVTDVRSSIRGSIRSSEYGRRPKRSPCCLVSSLPFSSYVEVTTPVMLLPWVSLAEWRWELFCSTSALSKRLKIFMWKIVVSVKMATAVDPDVLSKCLGLARSSFNATVSGMGSAPSYVDNGGGGYTVRCFCLALSDLSVIRGDCIRCRVFIRHFTSIQCLQKSP